MERLLKGLTIIDDANNNQDTEAEVSSTTSEPSEPSEPSTSGSTSILTLNMAIKNLAINSENEIKYDLVVLAQYIDAMKNQSNLQVPSTQMLHHCREVVKVLGNSVMTQEPQTWYYLHLIEEFLMQATNSVHPELRKKVIAACMDQMYMAISEEDEEPCAFAALALVVFDGQGLEMLDAARFMVEEALKASDVECLGTCLSNLFRWCYQWQGSIPLGQFTNFFIKALEEKQRYDVLLTVTLLHIERLFLALSVPFAMREPVSEAIFHVLACCRYYIPVFDKIAPHVGRILSCLATDSSQWSRQLLQDAVDILSAIVDYLIAQDNRIIQAAADAAAEDREPPPLQANYVPNRTKYAEVIRHLERHMASGDCEFLQSVPWREANLDGIEEVPPPQKKVGLHNLGNTCYMNSVIQALLATKQFSNSVILEKDSAPYWSRLCHLFTKMHHSISCKLNPIELFQVIKPPYFITNSQHDSSEFLVYMFETLQCYEYHSEFGFDYNNPPPRIIPAISMPLLNTDNECNGGVVAAGSGRRSNSPMPGSSSGSSAQGLKRSWPTDLDMPLKKRMRKEPKDKAGKSKNKSRPKHYESILDQLFGGVMLTRLQCAECGTCSFSRDVFRDLQLGFPEKLDNEQLSVQFLIEYYCSEERLCGDNRYRCPSCKQLQEAERSVLIDLPPKYLIIVLKNFRFEPKLQVHAKLMLDMHYNMTITLPTKNQQNGRPEYNLYAGVVHSGTTLDSGHYFTLAHDGEHWHEYNDEVVTLTTEDEINSLTHSCTPYILFYRRSDVLEPEPPTFDELCPSLRQMVESHHKHVLDAVKRIKTGQLTRP